MSITVTILAALGLSAGVILLMVAGAQRHANNFSETLKNKPVLLDPNGPPVQFILFTKNDTSVNLDLNKTLNETGFDFDAPTKIIIHGFLSSINDQVFTLPKNAYLSKGNYNVVGLDWSALCEFDYFSALRGARTAAKHLALFVEYLAANGIDYGNVHVIGHSLGAHVAGMGADAVRGGRVPRITALDPAGPGFGEVAHSSRLDPGDADLVDAIHTYMRVLSLTEPVGHVDFYPNGGRFQPGCPDFFDIWKVPESVTCNHGRAYLYFTESILNERAFKSRRCRSVEDAVYGRCFDDSEVYMGAEETYSYGIYYVKTRNRSPFSMSPEN